MTKFTKRILLIALIACLVGVVLCVVAACTGGFNELKQRGVAFIDRNGIDLSGIDLARIGDDDDYEGTLIKTNSLADRAELPVAVDEISSMNIEIAAAKLDVIYSADDKIRVGCSDEWYKFIYAVDDGRLILKTQDAVAKIGSTKPVDLIIELPKELSCDSIKIELAAGEFKFIPLQADNVEIELAAGTAGFEGLEAENIELEVGAGDLNVSHMDATSLDAEVGMGNLSVKLSGKETDYNYDTEIGMGNLDIGDGAYKDVFVGEKQIDNGADKNIKLEIGMGNTTIEFEE